MVTGFLSILEGFSFMQFVNKLAYKSRFEGDRIERRIPSRNAAVLKCFEWPYCSFKTLMCLLKLLL
jgi:hypothetical protein